jgi:uncharacterized protein YkwD
MSAALGAVLSLAWVTFAQAAPLSVVNSDRIKTCGGAGLKPLYYSTQLSEAARSLARGQGLRGAIDSSGYRAAESAEVHVSGVISERELDQLLTSHYCSTLTDARFKDFGAEWRGRELWMVFAAPMYIPKPRDGGTVAKEILAGVNAARAQGHHCGAKYFGPVPPLTEDASLVRAALAHSEDMARHDAFDHSGTDGSSPAERVERAGYGAHRIVGENIAAGAMTAREVTDGWLKSPPHCENIMDGRFKEIGIAFAENQRSESAVYWTQDFAARR